MRIVLVGDVCLAGEPEARLAKRPEELWKAIGSVSKESDVVIANVEHPLTDGGAPRPYKWANLRAKAGSAGLLGALDVAILANNHLGDFGDEAAQETAERLASLGIQTVGYGQTLPAALRPVVVERNGLRLAVVAMCCPTTNGENLATHLTPGVAPLGAALLRAAIDQAKAAADMILVYFHWGCEQKHGPVPDQVRLGRRAIDWGADAVVGCHAHVIQSYEQYRGRWIFHGLGNYLFGPVETREILPDGTERRGRQEQLPPNRESLVVTLQAIPEEGKTVLKLGSIQPVVFDENYAFRHVPATELTFDLAAENQRLSRYVDRCGAALSSTREPVFRVMMNNGVPAYFYDREPISDADFPTLARRGRRALRRLARGLGL